MEFVFNVFELIPLIVRFGPLMRHNFSQIDRYNRKSSDFFQYSRIRLENMIVCFSNSE